jgi:hypothetical protein
MMRHPSTREACSTSPRFACGRLGDDLAASRHGALWPGKHRIDVADGAGGHYAYSLAAQRPLGAGVAPPLTQALVPGESYTADVVFDVPAGARDLRLVIGHENSFLDKRTTLRLGA